MKKTIKTWMVAAFLFFVTGVSVLSMVFIRKSLEDLPSVSSLENYVPPLVTNIVDIHGEPIGQFFTERRTTVPLTKIPVDLRLAVIATEDTDFFTHWGVDMMGIFRAMVANVKAGRIVQGGSTLTQQLAKTIFLTRRKTFVRKFKELLLTLQIEYQYSKDEIIQLYLNQIYFGAGAFGVEAASQLYFDKNTQDLNLPESALLAGLIRSPNRYSPLRNPDLAVKRRALVLRRMRANNFITEKEELESNAYSILPSTNVKRSREAPYFLEEIKKILEPQLGLETLEQGGLTIQTTLDLNMQRAAEEVMQKHLDWYDTAHGTTTLAEYNEELLANTTEQIEISTVPPNVQGALVAMDVHTGAIRAMVGGRNFYESQFNRAVQAQRQPGSAFKPFVWGAALKGRFTPSTVLEDWPLVYIDMQSNPTLLAESTSYMEIQDIIMDDLVANVTHYFEMEEEDQKEAMRRYWQPKNYDGRYLGEMTVRTALQKSRNIASVRLIDNIGPRSVVNFAKKAGIKRWLSPVLSLSLGTSVVSLLELTNSYGTFASGGLHAEPYYIERVKDRRDNILLENSPKIEARLNPRDTYLLVNLMQGVVNHGTGWYAKRLNRPLAGKTGTTQDQRDLLFIGYSPDIVAGVWVGYDDFRPLRKGLSASGIAVPLWTSFMRRALKDFPPKEFPVPRGIEFAKIDAETGYLSLPTCPKVILESFRTGNIPTEFCPVDHDEEDKN